MTVEQRHDTHYELNHVDIKSLEKTRSNLNGALSVIYREIAQRELGDASVLSLGIGTGLVEVASGIRPDRIVGVDVSSTFLQKATERLPGAKFYQGRLPDVLSQVPEAPVAFASDCLNCVNPQTYPDVFRLLKDKARKVVIVNTRLPLPDFFEAVHPPVGIRSFSPEQQESIRRHLVDSGFANPPLHLEEWIQIMQSILERSLGQRFSVSYLDLLRRMEFFPFDAFTKRFAGEALFMQVLALFETFEANADTIDVLNPDYKQQGLAYITFEMALLFRASLATEYCQKLLTDAALEAGYKTVQRIPIAAVGDEIVDPCEVAGGVNKAIELFQTGSLTTDTSDNSLRMSINGANMQFRTKEPVNFDGVYTEYLAITDQ
jgi:hypothetical protein